MAELLRQNERVIPDKIKACEKDIQMMKPQKTKLDKEIAKIKDSIKQVDVQYVQLQGKGQKKLNT